MLIREANWGITMYFFCLDSNWGMLKSPKQRRITRSRAPYNIWTFSKGG